MELFIPDIYQESILKINYDSLLLRGIKCLLFDLDNTIIPYHEKQIKEETKQLFETLKQKGFKVIIYSNSSKKRVDYIKNILGVDGYSRVRKPNVKNFLKLIEDNKFEINEVAIIGDQLLTDVLGGNRVGITTILTTPISKKDILVTKINRIRERKIMKKLRNKSLFTKGRYYE